MYSAFASKALALTSFGNDNSPVGCIVVCTVSALIWLFSAELLRQLEPDF